MARQLACVIPTCRPDSFRQFHAAWKPLFEKHDVELIVVEDNESTWKELPDFIPYRTGSIRSWGFLRAWHEGYDVITLDDDVLPPTTGVDPIQAYKMAWEERFAVSDYFDVGHTFGLGEYMRGFPFKDRGRAKPVLQYGGWDNVPDLDAVTQGEYEAAGTPVTGFRFDRRILPLPRGAAFTGCIMNVAISHEALPMIYQLIMGIDRVGYDRYDDIWSALFAKKICDHLGLPIIINGWASVIHTRASDTASNLAKESGGYGLHEPLWDNLKSINLSGHTIIDCYSELAYQLNPSWFGPCGDLITDGMKRWLAAL